MPYETYKLQFEECEHVLNVPLIPFIASWCGADEDRLRLSPAGFARYDLKRWKS